MRPIHVACIFDRAMAIPALVLAWSIKKTMLPGRQIVFYAIACEDDAIPEDAPCLLNSEFFDFRPMRAPASALFGVDLSQSIVASPASLVRIDLPDIIPGPERILYLDCDILVRHPLDALVDVDLEGHAVAACADYLMTELIVAEGPGNKFARHITSLLADPTSYFNSGVLLIDCEKWRAGNYSQQLKSLLLSPPVTFLFADQDVLNSIFVTNYKRLDPRWNAFAYHPTLINDKEAAAIAALCETDPWITHFAGPAKPWLKHHAVTPHHRQYWEIARSSPFFERFVEMFESANNLDLVALMYRGVCRRAAEFLLTFSRALHFFETRLRESASLSQGMLDAGEHLYKRSID